MIDIHALSPDQRLQLIELLWDSLGPTPDAIPFTNEQRAELDRRLDDLDREWPVGIPAEQVLNGLDKLRK